MNVFFMFTTSLFSGEVTVLKRNDSFLLHSSSSSELDRELSSYASRKLEVEKMPAVDTLAAPKLCSTRSVGCYAVYMVNIVMSRC